MAWNKFKRLGFYTGRQIAKSKDRGRRPGILRILGLVIRHPYIVTHGEGKEDAPDVSAKNGTEYTACCVELQIEECWREEENQRERQRRSGYTLKWKWGSHVTRTDQR
jgi:hypothetical protein